MHTRYRHMLPSFFKNNITWKSLKIKVNSNHHVVQTKIKIWQTQSVEHFTLHFHNNIYKTNIKHIYLGSLLFYLLGTMVHLFVGHYGWSICFAPWLIYLLGTMIGLFIGHHSWSICLAPWNFYLLDTIDCLFLGHHGWSVCWAPWLIYSLGIMDVLFIGHHGWSPALFSLFSWFSWSHWA